MLGQAPSQTTMSGKHTIYHKAGCFLWSVKAHFAQVFMRMASLQRTEGKFTFLGWHFLMRMLIYLSHLSLLVVTEPAKW